MLEEYHVLIYRCVYDWKVILSGGYLLLNLMKQIQGFLMMWCRYCRNINYLKQCMSRLKILYHFPVLPFIQIKEKCTVTDRKYP